MLTSLRNTRAKARNGKRGFTLIEILTVVIIIGILAAIAIPTFFILQQRQRGNTMDNTAGNYINAFYAISQQANRAANNGTILSEGFDELPLEDRQNLFLVESDGLAVPTVDTNYGGEHIIVVQRFNDNARAGCIFLPPNQDQGDRPVYFRHGEEATQDYFWRSDDTDIFMAEGDIADVTEDDCQLAAGDEVDDVEFSVEDDGTLTDTTGAVLTGVDFSGDLEDRFDTP